MSRPAPIVWPCLIALMSAACHRSADPVREAIRTVVSADSAPAWLDGVNWKLMGQVYRDREYRPLWIGVPLPERTSDLIASLCDADREGLRPADYRLDQLRATLQRMRPSLRKGRPEALAALDLELTQRFLDYGKDLLVGRLDPRAVTTEWYIRERRASIDGTLRGAVQANTFAAMVAPLRPPQTEYAELAKALAGYREILRQGGWPRVPGHGRLRRGSRGERVAVLRRRLAMTGDLPDSADAGGERVYDRAVASAVARFQARHGLPADGMVGAATRAALNVPVRVRIRQIQLSLERYRWLPGELGSRYIYVNIPDYRLSAYEGGKPVLQMRVVVGDEYENATPVFADSMTSVVFRPYWYVPPRIVVDELIPRARKKRSYLARHHYEVLDAARESRVLDPRRINWSRVDVRKIRVRQKPGSTNHLGLVKFIFPNQFAVYLHDSPFRNRFARARRTSSHGCVWLEKPVELAEYVLAGQDGWDRKRIQDAMAGSVADSAGEGGSGDGRTVTLAQPVPVYLVYLTALVQDGVLNFRPDPYGKDRKPMQALGKLVPTDPRLRDELQKLIEG